MFPGTQESIGTIPVEESSGLVGVLAQWLADIAILTVQIILIVILIMILQELAMSYGLIENGKKALSPVLRFMGLSKETTVPWLVAIVGGVTIGSAVIIEECRRGTIPREELQYFHVSVGINHSMVEHSAVLSAIVGANIFFIILIRLVCAVLFTHTMRLGAKLLQLIAIKPRLKKT